MVRPVVLMNWMPTAELPTISFITFRAARESGSYFCGGPGMAIAALRRLGGRSPASRADSESAAGSSVSCITRTTAARIPPFREVFAGCGRCGASGIAIFDGIMIFSTRFRIAMAPWQGAPDQPIAVHCKNPRFPRAFCLDVTGTASLEPASNYAAGGRIRGLAQQRRSRAPKRCL